jgi:hypothetical protein
MCGSVVLIARDVPAAPVGERFRAVTRARRTFRGLIARTPIVPICNFPERERLSLSAHGVRRRSR